MTPELSEWYLRLLGHLTHHQCSDPKFYCGNSCLCILKFLFLGDCKFVSQGLRLKRSKLFMNTTAMDVWELDGIRIEICNTMFDCRFLAPFLSLSSICDAALNVFIILDVNKNMYADDPTSLLPCLNPHYLLLAHTERRLGSYVLFTQGYSSKKASHEKDPPQHHHFTSLYILVMHGVFLGVRGL